MNLNKKYVIYGGLALPAVMLYSEVGFDGMWNIVAYALAAIGLYLLYEDFEEKKPERKSPPMGGPREEFVPQREDWQYGPDGNAYRKPIEGVRR